MIPFFPIITTGFAARRAWYCRRRAGNAKRTTSFLIVAFAICATGVFAENETDSIYLRFESDIEVTDSFDESSVPEEFRRPDPGVALVSISAEDAAKPKSSLIGRTLEAVKIPELIDKLDVDRLLLSEIRKPVPDDRGEAESYLARLKFLAGRADPLRLVPLANRLLDQAPIYFDWLDRDFESQDEEVMEYYVGGARGFSYALDNFKTAVMFSIMNRLDVASRVIFELDSTR